MLSDLFSSLFVADCSYCTLVGITFVSIFAGLALVSLWNWYSPWKRCYSKVAYDELTDQVVLVTGASSGLGKELSRIFYHHGCRLIIASRRLSELERVKQQLQTESASSKSNNSNNNCPNPQRRYYEPKVVQLDLSNLESVSKVFQTQILPLYGRVDILVNNAGISSRGTVIDTDLIDVDLKMITVNYLSPVSLTKECIRSMISSGHRGRIITIGSVQGRFAVPNRSSYSASKHATQAFFDSLRSELSSSHPGQFQVSVISPGYIRTNLSVNALEGDGTSHGMVDQTTAGGYSTDYVAQSTIETMLNNRPELILCSIVPKLLILLRAVTPELYFKIMKIYARSKK